ncbi:MAG: hypothetical protein OEY49_16700 [Candidatus Heimdallarchaeota archaeon]|nr:hypothetical protein [Candidatus Heimdallarchaeota archaeon]
MDNPILVNYYISETFVQQKTNSFIMRPFYTKMMKLVISSSTGVYKRFFLTFTLWNIFLSVILYFATTKVEIKIDLLMFIYFLCNLVFLNFLVKLLMVLFVKIIIQDDEISYKSLLNSSSTKIDLIDKVTINYVEHKQISPSGGTIFDLILIPYDIIIGGFYQVKMVIEKKDGKKISRSINYVEHNYIETVIEEAKNNLPGIIEIVN